MKGKWLKIKNDYKIIDDDNIIIYLDRKDGSRKELFVDKVGFEKLKSYNYKWVALYIKSLNTWYGKACDYTDDPYHAKPVYIHRYLCGATDFTQIVDHIDYNGLNNRMSNLRISPRQGNDRHRSGANKNSKSGYRNVVYHEKIKKTPYHVQLLIDGKNTNFGKFATAEEASIRAREVREKYYGEYAGEGWF